MGQTEATRQSDWVLPAVVDANGNPNCVAVTLSTTVVAVDLTSITLPSGIYDSNQAAAAPNPLGHYINFQAQTADCYLLFGPTFASVTASNAPAAGTVNTVNGSTGAVTMAKRVCIWIPQGQTLGVKLPVGSQLAPNAYGQASPYRFVAGVTASGTATLRIWQSSI